jgi:hypothetical protein
MALAGFCMLLAAPVAQAGTFSITTNNDYGAGSLRQAIEDANDRPGADEIRFAVTGDIVLESMLPEVTDELAIRGPGADVVAINGNGQYRLLKIATGAVVDVTDITLADGWVEGFEDDGNGGGILNAGTLTLRNVTLTDCEADRGGALYNAPGAELALIGSVVEHSFAEHGAGVYNATGADLTLTASTITDTWAGTDGGGIYSYEADVVLTDSRIEHAHAGQFGGAIANDGPFNTTLGSLLVERSTLFGNFADYNSGAVYNRGRRITIRDSTLAHNNGGAIYTELEAGEVWLINSTLSDNRSDHGASAVYNFEVFPSLVVFIHSTFAENFSDEAAIVGNFASKNSIFDNDRQNCFVPVGGSFSDIGVNLSSDDSCGSFTQVTSAQLALGPLADNGGATPTHALLPGSVAIDAAPDCTDLDGEPIEADQRGIPRPADGDDDGTSVCDIGAFEVGTDVLFANGFE